MDSFGIEWRLGDLRSQSNTVGGRMLNMKMLVSHQLKRNVFFSFEMKENYRVFP